MTDERFEEIIELKCGECTDSSEFCGDYICTECSGVKRVKGIELLEFWQKIKELNDLSKSQLTELLKYQRAEADGLLARLPCKVGDKLYSPRNNSILEQVVVEISISDTIEIHVEFECDLDCKGCPHLHWYENHEAGDGGCNGEYGMGTFLFSDIGKIVFLTRPEAEQALKEAQRE